MKHLCFLALLTVLFGLPVLVLVLYAIGPGWSFPHLVPQTFDPRTLVWMWNQADSLAVSLTASLIFSLSTVGVTLCMCYAPASVLAFYHFRGKPLLEGLLLSPALVPPMTFAMGLHTLLIRWGLADTIWGIILVLSMFSYPYMLRALVAGFQNMGQTYALCAENLGAGKWMRLFQVELPLLVPSIVAGGTVVFLVAFSEYFLVFLIGGGTVPSFVGTLFPLLTSSDRASASALTLVFLLVPLCLFGLLDGLILSWYRRRGL